MKINFLFMDESISEAIDDKNTTISSLTGVLVPIHKYDDIRNEFYELLEWSIKPETNTINIHTPELHGREFLPDEDDSKKIEMLEGVVNLVVSNKLEIYRGGYYITNPLREANKGDENMTSIIWFGLLRALSSKLKKEMIIPVMDGFDNNMVRKFSQLVKQLDVMRSIGHDKNLSVDHSKNILGEVFYADSNHSVFTQVVDLISWLRQLSDVSSEGKNLTKYKQSLLPLSKVLDPIVIYDDIVEMELFGKKQSPNRT